MWDYSGGDEDLCVELMQECYIYIWTYLPNLSSNANWIQQFYWVSWQCRGALSHWKRRKKHEHNLIDLSDVDRFPAHDDSAAKETLEELRQLLNDEERQILDLLWQGYNDREIGQQLQIKTGTVKKKRQRLYQKIRSRYKI